MKLYLHPWPRSRKPYPSSWPRSPILSELVRGRTVRASHEVVRLLARSFYRQVACGFEPVSWVVQRAERSLVFRVSRPLELLQVDRRRHQQDRESSK